MEDFNTILANLLLSNDDKTRSRFYKALMNFKLNYEDDLKNSDIVQRLYSLYEKNILRKDLLLFSLLLNEDKTLFQHVVEYDHSNVKLDLRQPKAIFDFMLIKNRHWFIYIIENDYPNLENFFNNDVLTRINIAKLIYFSNLQSIDVRAVNDAFNKVYSTVWEDKIVNAYIIQIGHILNVMEHVQKHTKENCDITELYYYIWNNSVLNVLSKFTNLNESNNWINVMKLIKDEELILNECYNVQECNVCTQSETFASFTILFNIIKCIKLCHNLKEDNILAKSTISSTVEETKHMILAIERDTLLVEILEDIFVLIFIRETNQTQFFNNTNQLFLIILFLKSAINEINILKKIEKQSNIYKRYCNLCNHVTDALWRLELLTTINSDGKETTPKILQYMLAPPESLICYCLEKGNFDKANEVIQVISF